MGEALRRLRSCSCLATANNRWPLRCAMYTPKSVTKAVTPLLIKDQNIVGDINGSTLRDQCFKRKHWSHNHMTQGVQENSCPTIPLSQGLQLPLT